MKLLKRLLENSDRFHLTLINLCFAKFKSRVCAKQQISSFFARAGSSTHHQSSETVASPSRCLSTQAHVDEHHRAVNVDVRHSDSTPNSRGNPQTSRRRTLDLMWEKSSEKRLKLQGMYKVIIHESY